MAILERITKNVNNKYWDSGENNFPKTDRFPVKNRYTAGMAGQKFLEGIKEEAKIYGTRCEKCNVTFVPGKLYCERCFERLSDSWVEVGNSGPVHTFTVAWVEKDGSAKKKPSIIAAIKIADGFILHRLENCAPEEVKIGMEVKAKFKPKNQRKGHLMDISGFHPA